MTAEEKTAITEVRDNFIIALNERNGDGIARVIPPRIISHLANGVGISIEKFRPQMGSAISSAFGDITLLKVRIDVEGMPLTDKCDPNNECLTWGFAQTSMTFSTKDASIPIETSTLVLRDQGAWYLVRANDAKQVLLLRSVYPVFEDLTFPGTVMPAKSN